MKGPKSGRPPAQTADGFSATHPFEPQPNRIEVGRSRQAPNWVEAPVRLAILHQRDAGTLAHAASRLAIYCTTLAGPEVRPVAARAILTLVPEALN
jgi:hypothetical protein